MLKVADPTKLPNIPEDLSPNCIDFIKKCLIREYEKRPTALELANHPWL